MKAETRKSEILKTATPKSGNLMAEIVKAGSLKHGILNAGTRMPGSLMAETMRAGALKAGVCTEVAPPCRGAERDSVASLGQETDWQR